VVGGIFSYKKKTSGKVDGVILTECFPMITLEVK